jgi:hypothetical protein
MARKNFLPSDNQLIARDPPIMNSKPELAHIKRLRNFLDSFTKREAHGSVPSSQL